ncbi:MAG: outer membrane lipid asymmetry maintenance protein MlaD [Caldimonas sp.]
MGKKTIETFVGIFVLLGLLGLVFLALKAANLGSFSSGDTYTLIARFDNIGGLKVRAPVKSAGVTVGRVASIKLDPKRYQGLVSIEVSRDVQFPTDSSARILTSGLLGDQYLGIEPGAEEKSFAAGDEIKQTQSAVVLESLISQFLFSKAADAGSSAAPAPAAAPSGGKK